MSSYLYPRSAPPLYTKSRKAYKSAFPSLKEAYGKNRSRAAIDQPEQQQHMSTCEIAGPDQAHKDSLWESTKTHVPWTSHKSAIDDFGADSTNDHIGPLTPVTDDDDDDADALEAYYSVAKDDEHGDLIEQAATLYKIGTTEGRQRAHAILLKMADDDQVKIYDKAVCHYILATNSTHSIGDVFYHARRSIYYYYLIVKANLDTEEDEMRYTRVCWLMWAARRELRLDIQGMYRQLMDIAIDMFHRYRDADTTMRRTMMSTIGSIMAQLSFYDRSFDDVPLWIMACQHFFSAMMGHEEYELVRARETKRLFQRLIRHNPTMFQKLSGLLDCAYDLERAAAAAESARGSVAVLVQEIPPFSSKYYPRRTLEAGVFEPYVGEGSEA